jgi:hypothetical protein
VSISSARVAQVVAEVSSGAEDPQHVASVVGGFMQRQPLIGHFVASHQKELGAEGTVLTLLHASVLGRCIELELGRKLRQSSAAELDAAAREEDDERVFAEAEPALASYFDDNLAPSDPTLGGERRPVALKLLRLITRALLEQG